MLDLRMDCLRMDCSYKIKASTHKDLYPLKHFRHCHNFEDKINMFRKKCTEFSFLMDVKRTNVPRVHRRVPCTPMHHCHIQLIGQLDDLCYSYLYFQDNREIQYSDVLGVDPPTPVPTPTVTFFPRPTLSLQLMGSEAGRLR